MLKALVRNGVKVQTVVRPPSPDERRPEHLLPIPVTDKMGRGDFLWSAIILDSGETRTAIPEVWEPAWAPVDLMRGLIDLEAGGPLRLLMLNGADGEGASSAGLPGRWEVEYWNGAVDMGVDIILIEDGPRIDEYGSRLIAELREAAAAGIPIVIISGGTRQIGGALLGLAESFPSAVSVMDGPPPAFRRIDAALLERVGRGYVSDYYDSSITKKGWAAAGSRIRRWKGRSGLKQFDPEKISRIDFLTDREDSTNGDFTLQGGGSAWSLASGDWVLPARGERVERFLRHLSLGSGEVWETERKNGAQEANYFIRVHGGSRVPQVLEVFGTREAGGGAWIRVDHRDVLWPRLLPDEIRGDARYWMDRRLFPSGLPVTRIELRDSGQLRWRIHQKNEIWIVAGSGGEVTVSDQNLALNFVQQMKGSEAVTLTPTVSSSSSLLILFAEDSFGRRRELRLMDSPKGYFTAESPDGITYILSEATALMLLSGPDFD